APTPGGERNRGDPGSPAGCRHWSPRFTSVSDATGQPGQIAPADGPAQGIAMPERDRGLITVPAARPARVEPGGTAPGATALHAGRVPPVVPPPDAPEPPSPAKARPGGRPARA